MAKNDLAYDNRKALPNKLLQKDGTITDLMGHAVTNAVDAYNKRLAIPNKFLNSDGTYSTLEEILSGAIDTDIFVIVDELPATGDEKKIYLLPDGKGGFYEYHYHNSKWDMIGTIEIDLSNYYTKAETNQAIATAIQTSITQVLGGSY